MRKKLLTMVILCVTALSLTACDSSNYKKAMSLYESGEYEDAANMFSELGDYEDSVEMVTKCNYENAVILFDNGAFESAIAIFEGLGDYMDSADKLAEAEKEVMLINYADTIEMLEQETWYFNGGSETVLNYLQFEAESATVGQVYFDGNGKHENSNDKCSYVIDDKNIVITLNDGTELTIPYETKDAMVVFGNEYVASADVKASLLGYWKSRVSQTIMGMNITTEKNIYIGENTLESESATTAAGGSAGEYYYYGPYTGAYTLNVGGFETEMMHGSEWFFNIVDGEVILLNYDHVCTRSDALPGFEGYSFE